MVVAVQNLCLYPGNQALGIRQGEGSVVGAPERAPALVESANEGLAHRLLAQRDASQD